MLEIRRHQLGVLPGDDFTRYMRLATTALQANKQDIARRAVQEVFETYCVGSPTRPSQLWSVPDLVTLVRGLRCIVVLSGLQPYARFPRMSKCVCACVGR